MRIGVAVLTASVFLSTPLLADEPPEFQEVKSACDRAISDWAKQFDPIKVDTIVTGSIREEGKDRTALLDVKIDYNRDGGVETRQAKIECRVGQDGKVAVKESAK